MPFFAARRSINYHTIRHSPLLTFMSTRLFGNTIIFTLQSNPPFKSLLIPMSPNKPDKYRGLIIGVAIPSPLRQLFDYLPPVGEESRIQPGMRVCVSFGKREVIGIVVESKRGSTLDPNRLKMIGSILDREPLFSPALFKTLMWGAAYYQHPIGEVFQAALPVKLRSKYPLKADTAVYRLAGPIDLDIRTSLKRAKMQKALLKLVESESEVSRSRINSAGFKNGILNQLLKKNLLKKHMIASEQSVSFAPLENPNTQQLPLNDVQKIALKAILKKPDSFACYLIDGVTGSGKTEVYMQLMHHQLAAGRQCLVLVPEISLTPQTVSRFRERFSCPVAVLHSGLSDVTRLASWRNSREGSAAITIGTRSAIFTPLANPGMIIVDEEHDASFKQQEGFRYSARDLAVVRAKQEDIPVILGSATPCLESLHNCMIAKFEHLRLGKRAGEATPVTAEIVDISNSILESGFSEQLLYKIQKQLDLGNQIIVFINRRGFAPVLICNSCGWIAECDKCIAQLTVHTKQPGLRCHHCGTIDQLPVRCPTCKSTRLSTFGIGTQKIELFLEQRFPLVPVLRIDRDSIRSKKLFESMLGQVNSGNPCILLGTQMLAKGHHFPGITLVAVLDADSGLFSADFRGQEHIAQTITQVSGRAGRSNRKGVVLIQSRHAAHATLQSLAQGSYAEFAALLLKERKKSAMPPFSKLTLLRAEAMEMEAAIDFLGKVNFIITEMCRNDQFAIDRVGPIPAPMEKKAGKFRGQLILKSTSRGMMQKFLSQLCPRIEALRTPAGVRWSVDVDAQDLT